VEKCCPLTINIQTMMCKPERAFIAKVYNAIFNNVSCGRTALLIVYDEHGGIYDQFRHRSVRPRRV